MYLFEIFWNTFNTYSHFWGCEFCKCAEFLIFTWCIHTMSYKCACEHSWIELNLKTTTQFFLLYNNAHTYNYSYKHEINVTVNIEVSPSCIVSRFSPSHNYALSDLLGSFVASSSARWGFNVTAELLVSEDEGILTYWLSSQAICSSENVGMRRSPGISS